VLDGHKRAEAERPVAESVGARIEARDGRRTTSDRGSAVADSRRHCQGRTSRFEFLHEGGPLLRESLSLRVEIDDAVLGRGSDERAEQREARFDHVVEVLVLDRQWRSTASTLNQLGHCFVTQRADELFDTSERLQRHEGSAPSQGKEGQRMASYVVQFRDEIVRWPLA
jgi:hypothetical protein